MRHDVARDPAALVRDAYDDILGALAYGDFDGRYFIRLVRSRVRLPLALVLLHDALHRVPQQLADDVLEMAQDVREVGVEVAVDVDLRDRRVRPVRVLGYLPDRVPAPLDDFLGYAFEEDLADEFGLGELGAGREPGRMEGIGQGEVLLGNYAAGDAL